MNKAYYSNFINNFLVEDNDSIYGKVATNYDKNELQKQQSNAWISQIEILKKELSDFTGKIYFEFKIPRMGKRVDNILIIDNCIFVIEFKIDAPKYDKHAKEQAFDYGLDLNNFHEGSHNKIIVPILVASNAKKTENSYEKSIDNLCGTIFANKNNLSEVIKNSLLYFKSFDKIDCQEWENSIYKPTPTIIEAATALYNNHKVEDITKYEAGEDDLSKTSQCINDIIDSSKRDKKKSICFIT